MLKSEVFNKYKRPYQAPPPSESQQQELASCAESTEGNALPEFSPEKGAVLNDETTSAHDEFHEAQIPIREHSQQSKSRVAASPIDETQLQDVTDWDHINEQEEMRRKAERQDAMRSGAGSSSSSSLMTFKEAYEGLREDTTVWRKHVTADLKRLSDSVETTGFWGALWSCWHTDISEGSDEYTERDFVLALQFVTLDHSKPLHQHMLITIFRKLTRPPRAAKDPATIGAHWERLGFQGSDPGTDLRSTGILGLLQMMYLIDFYPTFAGVLFSTATNPLSEFPFSLVCFNFSGVAMESLKERGLHDDIARRKKLQKKITTSTTVTNGSSASAGQSTGTGGVISNDYAFEPLPVMHSVCEFYVGSLFTFFLEWKKCPTRSVTEFGPIKAKLRGEVRGNVAATIKQCSTARDRKKVTDITTNRNNVQFTSTNPGADNKEFMEF